LGGGRDGRPLDETFDSKNELLRVEGLSQVVVSTFSQTTNAFWRGIQSGEKEYRQALSSRIRLQPPEEIIARLAGHHDIQDSSVRPLGHGLGQSIFWAIEGKHSVAGSSKSGLNDYKDGGIVIDDENCGHGIWISSSR